MTRKEAIEILKELWCYEKSDKYTDEEIRKAISAAISSLETDAIPKERIAQMVAEIEQIHSDWFKEYDSATAYTKISEFIHKYTKECEDD